MEYMLKTRGYYLRAWRSHARIHGKMNLASFSLLVVKLNYRSTGNFSLLGKLLAL